MITLMHTIKMASLFVLNTLKLSLFVVLKMLTAMSWLILMTHR